MNNLQRIASLISGYELNETSARDDGYYEKEIASERLAYIMTVASVADDVEPLSINESLKVMKFLETEFNGQNERFHAFQEL